MATWAILSSCAKPGKDEKRVIPKRKTTQNVVFLNILISS
jgi:hypothetical protein